MFEVPYEMPFIAITERAFARLVNEQYAVLERGTQVHERLERLVIEGRAGGDPGLDRVGGRRLGGRSGRRRSRARPHSPSGGPRRRALKALGAEAAARRATSRSGPFEPQHESLAGGRWPCRCPGGAAARRSPG